MMTHATVRSRSHLNASMISSYVKRRILCRVYTHPITNVSDPVIFGRYLEVPEYVV